MDFISADVNDKRAPKGLTCPTITAIPNEELPVKSCPLCNSPRTLGIIQEKEAEGQGVSAGTSTGKQAKDSVDETATNATDGPAGRRVNGPEDNQIGRRA